MVMVATQARIVVLAISIVSAFSYQQAVPASFSTATALRGGQRRQGAAGVMSGRRSFILSCTLKLVDGRLLYPGDAGSGWFDARTAAMPVVLPPHRAGAGQGENVWKMWYYGRDGEKWSKDKAAFLPTGVTGYAESPDGLRWTRVKGPHQGGAGEGPEFCSPDKAPLPGPASPNLAT